MLFNWKDVKEELPTNKKKCTLVFLNHNNEKKMCFTCFYNNETKCWYSNFNRYQLDKPMENITPLRWIYADEDIITNSEE